MLDRYINIVYYQGNNKIRYNQTLSSKTTLQNRMTNIKIRTIAAINRMEKIYSLVIWLLLNNHVTCTTCSMNNTLMLNSLHRLHRIDQLYR
jgi:hypothetical protein